MNIILPKYFTSEIYFNLLLNILDLESVALYITMNTVCYRYNYSGRPYTDRFVSPPNCLGSVKQTCGASGTQSCDQFWREI